MNSLYKYLILTAIALLLLACNSTKYVPAGEYLLTGSRIQTDANAIPKDELNAYVRQKPNVKIFGLVSLPLALYNVAPRDTSTGWNRFWSKTFKRLGNEPVIYSESQTRLSAQEIQKLLSNRGYINAKVTTNTKLTGRNVDVRYIISANEPYLIGTYNVTPINPVLEKIAADTSRTLIRRGMLFNVDVLNAECERIAREFTERGFYNFDKEYLMFIADSTGSGNSINLRLDLRRYLRINSDSANSTVFKRYRTGNIYYHNTGTASTFAAEAEESSQKTDTATSGNFYLINSEKKIVSLNALIQNTYINPNSIYNSSHVEKTYSALNSLGAIRFVNIGFAQRNDSILDCNITISPSKPFSTSLEVEGTYVERAGYFGGAMRIGTVHKNAFKGAETLSFQGRIAAEWQKNNWAQEYGLQAGLNIPKFLLPAASYNFRRRVPANTEFTVNFNYQRRPNEFDASNIGAGMKYVWNRTNFRHNFELFNLSYAWFDLRQEFISRYLNTGEYNRHNYDNRFILRMGYSGSYSTFNPNRPLKDYSTYRYGIETAGNLLYGIYKIADAASEKPLPQNLAGFSQYVRGDFNISHHQIIDENNRFVLHFGTGIGIPYANSDIIPYERRFFSGGSNSVRGWSESTLGPGTYKRIPNVRSRDFNQVGDIKLDMNMEYRAKMFWLLEGALFLDAGNIWTVKDYAEQQGGVFRFSKFLNQIAFAYGFGLRLDATMFIVRIDVGMKLFDPVYESRTQRWRTGSNFNWKDDSAFHIAIGYPF